MKPIVASDLNHRIVIQQQTHDVDTSGAEIVDPITGEPITIWVTFRERWAKMYSPSGRMMYPGGTEVMSQVETIFVLRNEDGYDDTMRIFYKNKYFDIEDIRQDPWSGIEWLFFDCKSGINEGGQAK